MANAQNSADDLFRSRVYKVLHFFLIAVFFVAAANFIGCEKKTENTSDNSSQTGNSSQMQQKPQKEEPPAPVIPDVTGTYTGSFDKHGATFKITEQDSTEFKGTLTIAYRKPLTKKVSGSLDVETSKITMKDLIRSRYEGTYTADLSDNGQKITGTFTMKVDKKNYGFSFKKK